MSKCTTHYGQTIFFHLRGDLKTVPHRATCAPPLTYFVIAFMSSLLHSCFVIVFMLCHCTHVVILLVVLLVPMAPSLSNYLHCIEPILIALLPSPPCSPHPRIVSILIALLLFAPSLFLPFCVVLIHLVFFLSLLAASSSHSSHLQPPPPLLLTCFAIALVSSLLRCSPIPPCTRCCLPCPYLTQDGGEWP